MTAPFHHSAAGAPSTSSTTPLVTLLRIRLLRWREFPATAENDYRAAIIRDSGRLFYRAKGVTVPITACEARQVVRNPFTYYFSTALKLELRIDRARKGLAVDVDRLAASSKGSEDYSD